MLGKMVQKYTTWIMMMMAWPQVGNTTLSLIHSMRADRLVDSDGDGHTNYCEFKWDTNPRNPISFPGQGELCDPFEGQ